MRFQSLLKKLAKKSNHHRSQHAAVVAQGKRILGSGWNREGHHAEQVALWAAFGQTKGTTLYTSMLRRRSGTVGDGTPCPSCMAAIRSSGVKRVVIYT